MVDSKNLITLPPVVRALLIALLLAIFLGGTWLVWWNIGKEGFRDWVVVGMSILQMASTGLLVAIVLFFAEADVSVKSLQCKTKRWLLVALPEQMGKITLDGTTPVAVLAPQGLRDIFGAQYEIDAPGNDCFPGARIRCWVGLNVNRVIVIYWSSGTATTTLEAAFRPTFVGASSVGWTPATFQEEPIDGRLVTSIWTTWTIQGEGFLKDPEKQLFVAQDIAMMTQSLLRSAARKGIDMTAGDLWPRPL